MWQPFSHASPALILQLYMRLFITKVIFHIVSTQFPTANFFEKRYFVAHHFLQPLLNRYKITRNSRKRQFSRTFLQQTAEPIFEFDVAFWSSWDCLCIVSTFEPKIQIKHSFPVRISGFWMLNRMPPLAIPRPYFNNNHALWVIKIGWVVFSKLVFEKKRR